jgi:hypothetical protein
VFAVVLLRYKYNFGDWLVGVSRRFAALACSRSAVFRRNCKKRDTLEMKTGGASEPADLKLSLL